jgi:hypothetical protein
MIPSAKQPPHYPQKSSWLALTIFVFIHGHKFIFGHCLKSQHSDPLLSFPVFGSADYLVYFSYLVSVLMPPRPLLLQV